MIRVFPLNLSTVVFPKTLLYLPLFFYCSLIAFPKLSDLPTHCSPWWLYSALLSTCWQKILLAGITRSRLDATELLTSDLAIISGWAEGTWCPSMPQRFNFPTCQRNTIFQASVLVFSITLLSPSSKMNINGLSVTQNLNWKLTSVFLNQLPQGQVLCVISTSCCCVAV